MTEESFNKAPGSEFSKSRSTIVTMSNVKVASPALTSSGASVPLPERMHNPTVGINQDYPYTILQYGHLLPTLVQPGFSMFHPPPPPVPVTIPVFYQPVNGNLPQPQPFETNMFYRCVPQLPGSGDVFGQKISWAKCNAKIVPSKVKHKDPVVDFSKSDAPSGPISDAPLSPAIAPVTSDRKREVAFGCTGVVVGQEKLMTLTEMAMQGCELAEQLANNHHKRPCFKKIDSLCARMKQDLIRPDSVLANINSQGIAWAVKDFIFVFTRIINAWIIIKGYVYNTPEGLERVQKVMSPDFLDHFLKWQDSTIDFVDSLIKSFTSLDQMVQTQRASCAQKESSPKVGTARQSKTDEEKERNIQELYEYLKDMIPNLAETKANSSSDNASSSDLSDRSSVAYDNTKSYLCPVVNNSEQTQMKHSENGTYFKTGIYEPVRKPPGFDASTSVTCSKKIPFPLVDSNAVPFATSTPKILKNPISHNRPDVLGSLVSSNEYDGESTNTAGQTTTEVALSSQLQMDFFNDAIIRQSFDSETVAKIHFLLQKVFSVNEAKYFLVAQFTKNYFPDFHTINPNFKDLRAIISKAQIGGYQTISGIVYDLRQIVRAARRYLEQKSSSLLEETADEFERSLEDILCDKIFDCYDFNRLPGSTSPTATVSSQSSTSATTACSAEF
ncbi:protein mitoshell [Ochlerotatus camptorhynchus]|uniref:protein mitoshell n=1 Tax=Ochlerotatus camptorhynchus TaxID=644619 RepID=UPI0031CDF2CA